MAKAKMEINRRRWKIERMPGLAITDAWLFGGTETIKCIKLFFTLLVF
jgi:hypothetical protein